MQVRLYAGSNPHINEVNAMDTNISKILYDAIVKNSKQIHVAAGEYIVRESIPVQHFYFLVHGNIKLVYENTFGESLIIDIYHSGDFFGEMEMIDVKTKSRNLIALTDCHLCVLTRKAFFTLWKFDDNFSLWVLEKLCNRLNKAGDEKFWSEQTKLREKIFHIVKINANDHGYFIYTKHILAELSGISIRSLNRTLKELEVDGRIMVSAGTIRLKEE